ERERTIFRNEIDAPHFELGPLLDEEAHLVDLIGDAAATEGDLGLEVAVLLIEAVDGLGRLGQLQIVVGAGLVDGELLLELLVGEGPIAEELHLDALLFDYLDRQHHLLVLAIDVSSLVEARHHPGGGIAALAQLTLGLLRILTHLLQAEAAKAKPA